MKHIHPFIGKHYRYAVVGASNNPEKYGNIVFHDLLDAGFMVVPVNAHEAQVDGVRAHPSLRTIHPPIDVAVIVVPPAVGLTILDDAKAAGVQKLWFQPGAESEDIRAKAGQLGLVVQADGACVMVARRQLGVG